MVTASKESRRGAGASLVVGEWAVRPTLGELRSQGEVVHLEPKMMAVLLHLTEHAGEVCSRESLLHAVWADAFVTEEVVTHAVWELRRLLGDDAKQPRYIQTVPKRGYRLVAEVSWTEVEAGRSAGPAVAGEAVSSRERPLSSGGRSKSTWRWGIAALAVLGIAIGSVWTVTRGKPPPHGTGAITSLAVLPFDNIIDDAEQQYFVDGMTEALITNLSKIGALKVISRTSVMRYKATDKSIAEIAQELGVDALVEGSVLLAGEDVRISAQLIDGETDEHLWAESYTRPLEDVLTLHSVISRAIADEIEVVLTADEADRLAGTRRVDPEAFQAYLRGLYLWNKRTPEGLWGAADLFQRAIAIQPDYALAHAGLANTYVLLGTYGLWEPDRAYGTGRAAALTALQIDDSVAQALAALGTISYFSEWNWSKAEREFQRAIELSPSYATAHQYYAELLAYTGRHEEAVEEIRVAQELDPLSLIIGTAGGEVLFHARQYDEAIAQLRRVLEMDHDFWRTHRELGKVYFMQQRYAEAAGAFEKAIALLDRDVRMRDELACAHAAAGKREEAFEMLEELRTETPPRAWDVGLLSLCLGDTEEALAWLERAVDERSVQVGHRLKSYPWLDPLRDEPRFQALLKRMNFPD